MSKKTKEQIDAETRERLRRNAERLRSAAAASNSGDVNAYISARLAEARAAALEKSRTRTMPAVPVGGADDSKKKAAALRNDASLVRSRLSWPAYGQGVYHPLDFNYSVNGAIGLRHVDPERLRIAALRRASELEKEAELYDAGKKLANGASCIYTATDNYGKQYRVASNRVFEANDVSNGFLRIPMSDVEPGDIVQSKAYGLNGAPGHGMILDSIDGYVDNFGFGRGDPAFNYSNGGEDENAIVRGGHFADKDSFRDDNQFNAFRFVGTPADSLRWKNEYEQMNQRGSGGFLNRFDMGGPGSIGGYPAVPSLMMKLLDPRERKILRLNAELKKMEEEREQKRNEYWERLKESRKEFDAEAEEARKFNDYKRDRFNAIIDNGSAPIYILRGTMDGTLLRDFDGNDIADAQETDRAVFGYPPINYEERDLGDKMMYRSYFNPDALNVAPTWRIIYHRKGEKPDTVMYEGDRDLWKKIDEAAVSVLPENIVIYRNKQDKSKQGTQNKAIAFPFAKGGLLRRFDEGGDKDGDGVQLYYNPSPDDIGVNFTVAPTVEPLHVETPYTPDDFFERWYPNRMQQVQNNMATVNRSNSKLFPNKKAGRDARPFVNSMLRNAKLVKEYTLLHPGYSTQERFFKFPNALKDSVARNVLNNSVRTTNRILKKEILEDYPDDDLRWEGFGTHGFSKTIYPHLIFYTEAEPSENTIVHERTHPLRPELGSKLGKNYMTYPWLSGDAWNPMEYKIATMLNQLMTTEKGRNLEPQKANYYFSPEEINARMNAIREQQNLNPKHKITKEDLQEIKKNASRTDRDGFLDLIDDDSLLRLFNEVADASTSQEKRLHDKMGGVNSAASGGLIERYGRDAVLAALKKKRNEYGPGGRISGPVSPGVITYLIRNGLLRLLPEDVAIGVADLAHSSYGDIGSLLKKIRVAKDVGEEKRDELDDIGNLFLLDRGRQKKLMEEMGYHLADDDDYGLVKSATKNLSASRLGDKIPIYQYGEDVVPMEDVEPIILDNGLPYYIYSSAFDPTEAGLNHAGRFPQGFYRHKKTGELYMKGWDLNDYGGKKISKEFFSSLPERISNALFNSGYDVGYAFENPDYGENQFAGEVYNQVGNPFVQRSALVKVPDDIKERYFIDGNPIYKNGEHLYAGGGKLNQIIERYGREAVLAALKKRSK